MLVAASLSTSTAHAQADAATADAPVVESAWSHLAVAHVRILGDLDSAHLLAASQASLAKARDDGAEAIVLELNARRWRTDILLGLARALRPEGWQGRTVVLIAPSLDHTSPLALASLGLTADACFLAPRAKFIHDPADELAAFLPEDTDPDSLERDLRGLAWTSLQSRSGDALLTTLVPRPTAALFLATSGGEVRLATEPPHNTSHEPLIRPASSNQKQSLDAQTSQRIGLITGQARSTSECLSKCLIRPRKTLRFEIVSQLALQRERFSRELADIDQAKRRAKGAIDAVYSLKALDQVARQRRVGSEQLFPLKAALDRLEATERIAIDYPELLREVPPGTTEIGQDTRAISFAWKSYFQFRRNDLAALLDKAATLSEKK